MIKMITDKPSEWKNWIIEAIGNIDESMVDVDCIGMVIMPKDRTKKKVFTAYYNASTEDKLVMKEHIGMDAIYEFIGRNMDRLTEENGIDFIPDFDTEEDGEDNYSKNDR